MTEPSTISDILRRGEARRRKLDADRDIDLGPSWADLCRPVSGKILPRSAYLSNQGFELTDRMVNQRAAQNRNRLGQRPPPSLPKTRKGKHE